MANKTLSDLYDVLERIAKHYESADKRRTDDEAKKAAAAREPSPVGSWINRAAGGVRSAGGALGSRNFSGAADFFGKISKFASSAGEAEGASGAASGASGALGGAGEAVAGLLAVPGVGEAVAVVAGAAALAAAFAGLTKAVVDTATSFLEGQRQFAEASGEMASVFARFDVFQLQQGQRIGDTLAPAAGDLEKSLEGLMNTIAPYTTAIYYIIDELLSFIVDVFNVLIQSMEELLLMVAKLVDWAFDTHVGEAAKLWLAKTRAGKNEGGNLREFLMLDKRRVINPGPA